MVVTISAVVVEMQDTLNELTEAYIKIREETVASKIIGSNSCLFKDFVENQIACACNSSL